MSIALRSNRRLIGIAGLLGLVAAVGVVAVVSSRGGPEELRTVRPARSASGIDRFQT